MKMNRRTFVQMTSVASALALLPVARLASAASQEIKYGGSAWLGHYPAYVAMADGSLEKAGINQDWQSFGTSSARMSALMSGNIDIACTGVVSALALMARGAQQFAIIAIPDSFGRVEGILAREDVNSIEDLKGKKIGVTFASSAHLLVLDVLEQAGLTQRDVSVLNVPAPELPAAMQSGQIDAAAAWTPQFNNILRQPGVKILADDTNFSLYKEFNVTPGPDVLVIRRDFAQKNQDLVKTYLDQYFKGNQLLREQPEQAAELLLPLTNLSLEEQVVVVNGADWYSHEQQKELLTGKYIAGLQALAELLVEHKQIDKAPIVKDWIDTTFA